MTTPEKTKRLYRDHFGSNPTHAAAAPGRVEIMGNHTDYNGGFVLPAALDRSTVVAGSPVNGDAITLIAADYDRRAEFSAANLKHDPANSWADYVVGVVDQVKRLGVSVSGFQAVIHSDVPAGAGLSSSAALEVATAYFLRQLFRYSLDPMEIASLCQRAENEFVGVACGILDQFSSVFGHAGSLLFLDCATLEHDTVTIAQSDIAIVICDSGAKHALTGGDYNTRRRECMSAAAHFGKALLRDVSWEEFEAREHELPPNEARRARHVLSENRRVLALRQAIQEQDTAVVGTLLAAGHASCRDMFDNTTPEIDFLADTAMTIDGCIGAKLTGGGWGGCTVNLVRDDAVAGFSEELISRYKGRFGLKAAVYPCHASAGARELPLTT